MADCQDTDFDEGDLMTHIVQPKRDYPPDVDVLIIHALKIPRHPSVPDAYSFRGLVVKTVNVFGTVVARRTFGTVQSYCLSDDTGAIWVDVGQNVQNWSRHENQAKLLNSRLEKHESTKKNNPDDAILHGVLKSLMKEVNEQICKSSKPFPLGTVLKVRGWLLDSCEFRKVRANQCSCIEDPHKEAELMEHLASLYCNLYTTK